ncbi:MAG TPA: DUF2782 domain-containing protein [Methylophilaceae bacterium]|nr:DUF2782 domain-containing protein [Methylophilus sp.]HAJ71830.1 DUF2782 domain-containing protein [Methylophilaceae bacterium]
MHKLKSVLLTLCIFPLSIFSAYAAQPSNAEPLEEVPPPPKVIEGQPMDEPEISIRKKGEDTIEEYRIHGELYMMKVTPKSGVPYYLHKQEENGAWVNVGPNPPLSVPHWILFRF